MWNKKSLIDLIDQHLQRYPRMEARDVYKLLFQGVLGSEHLIASPESFAQYLKEEFSQVGMAISEPVFDAIRPDERLWRVNLRPYRDAGGTFPNLLEAALLTGRMSWQSQRTFCAIWDRFLDLCVHQQWPSLQLEAAQEFHLVVVQHGFPAVHHSSAYGEAYHPAYRLVAAEFKPALEELCSSSQS